MYKFDYWVYYWFFFKNCSQDSRSRVLNVQFDRKNKALYYKPEFKTNRQFCFWTFGPGRPLGVQEVTLANFFDDVTKDKRTTTVIWCSSTTFLAQLTACLRYLARIISRQILSWYLSVLTKGWYRCHSFRCRQNCTKKVNNGVLKTRPSSKTNIETP
jgi:hypothetical protein